MKSNYAKILAVLSIIFLLSIVVFSQSERVIPKDFTFIQVSDLHTPVAESGETIALLKNNLGAIKLEPYNNIITPPPSFIVVTGDLTEYGGLKGNWEKYLSFFNGITIPIYHELGNHDNTWYCGTKYLRELYGSPNYSFDRNGVHFIGICDSTYQEPIPSLGVEALSFLKEDLAVVGKKMPIIVFFHHPLDSDEFSSRYEVNKFLDILKPYNVILALVGHGHEPRHHNFNGIDGIQGGTTFRANAGYAVLSFINDTLRVVYKYKDPTKKPIGLLEKKLSSQSPFPDIEFLSLKDRDVISQDTIKLAVKINDDANRIKSAKWIIDDEVEGDLVLNEKEYQGMINVSELISGAHYLRVNFVTTEDKKFNKSISFYKVGGKKAVKWRTFLDGSIKSNPLIYQNKIIIGANDGYLYCLDKETSEKKWSYKTGGEILSSPINEDGLILFGSADGYFYALNDVGVLKWRTNVGDSIYSSPVVKEGIVYFGIADGRFMALNIKDGSEKWVFDRAGYCIESRACIHGDMICFGAWDSYFYALNRVDGSLLWKTYGVSSSIKRAKKYYSPADANPVAVGMKIFVADRGYKLGVTDRNKPEMKEIASNTAAIALSADKNALFLRRTDNKLTKIKLTGEEIWTIDVEAGRFPVSPTVKGDKVYVCSNRGLLSAINEANGNILWQYQVTPRMYAMSEVAVDDDVIVVGCMDGSVTCFGKY